MEAMHDIFIPHSNRDEQPVRGLARRLREWGFDVQVDFEDPTLKKPADRELAASLRNRFGAARVVLFAFSSASANSKWLPWQLGLAHGAAGRVVLWPFDGGVKWTSQTREYLSLYESVDPENAKEFLENLVGGARRASLAPPQVEATPAAVAETAVVEQPAGRPDMFTEMVANGAQLYMAWLNALTGKR